MVDMNVSGHSDGRTRDEPSTGTDGSPQSTAHGLRNDDLVERELQLPPIDKTVGELKVWLATLTARRRAA